jgi:hypothetical protein
MNSHVAHNTKQGHDILDLNQVPVKLWCPLNINLQMIDFHVGDDYIGAVTVNKQIGASG